MGAIGKDLEEGRGVEGGVCGVEEGGGDWGHPSVLMRTIPTPELRRARVKHLTFPGRSFDLVRRQSGPSVEAFLQRPNRSVAPLLPPPSQPAPSLFFLSLTLKGRGLQ